MKLPRIFLIAAALFFVSAGTASAAPCWKTLINDWYDGRIDKTYDAQCYRDAIKHLPPDVEVYSNAKDDLKRALQNVLAGKPPNQGLGSGGTGGNGGTGTGATGSGGKGAGTGGRDTNGGPVPKAIKDIGPKSADSVPIPLLVLGGLALLLIAAGAAGVVAKRLQGRKPGT
jgi:hypothetical protein